MRNTEAAGDAEDDEAQMGRAAVMRSGVHRLLIVIWRLEPRLSIVI